MNKYDISRLCLRCMRISDDNDICPFCGHNKIGEKTWQNALTPGTILNNKILIGNILGKGGYGITYIGFDLLLEYRVAIKEFFPEELVTRAEDGHTLVVKDEINSDAYEEETQAYLREARILAEYSKNPGIVSIKDLFYENNTGYIVMEYLENGNLFKYVDNHGGWLPSDRALTLIEPIIDILGDLHQSGLIHRDVSPDNIMIDKDGSIKLIDFGGSRKNGVKSKQDFLGKWGFAPPEQMFSRVAEQGPWTDIYGICSTLYYLCTGDIPQSAIEREDNDLITPINSYNIDLDPGIGESIMKGLSMKPEDRQQTIDELYFDLYSIKRTSKQSHAQESVAERRVIVMDHDGRVWFGSYPMNEVTPENITSDIECAEYDENNTAIVNEEKYYRLPVYKNAKGKESSNFLSGVFNLKHGRVKDGYKYFKYNAIPWRVVNESKGRTTLISEYILDYLPFNGTTYLKYSDRDIVKVRTGVYWGDSKLRAWLNSAFINMAFSAQEKIKLHFTKISTPTSALDDRYTNDKVYIPSLDELYYGFDTSKDRIDRSKKNKDNVYCRAPISQYTAAIPRDPDFVPCFGLRSRGQFSNDMSFLASEDCYGQLIGRDGPQNWMLNKRCGIRPVICVSSDSIKRIS